jgi:hypothetical protein
LKTPNSRTSIEPYPTQTKNDLLPTSIPAALGFTHGISMKVLETPCLTVLFFDLFFSIIVVLN